jgi:hypothetical protein
MGQELSWCSGFCLGLNLTENQSAKLWGMGTKYGVWHSMLHILRTEGMSFRMGQAYGPYNQTLKTVFSLNNLNTSSRKFRLDCVRSSISLGYTLGLCLFFCCIGGVSRICAGYHLLFLFLSALWMRSVSVVFSGLAIVYEIRGQGGGCLC